MPNLRAVLRDTARTLGVLAIALAGSLLLQKAMPSQMLVPAVFVLAVDVVALVTDGYVYGIAASLLSVLALNYAFTAPYFLFDWFSAQNALSAGIMLAVTIITSTLTTQRKRQSLARAEAAREAMRANLLRAISHDLRTPLTAIYGSCSAIIENYDRLPKDQQLRLLGEMRGEADWLIRMVENLLSVTRIDGGRVRIAKTPTVVEELLDSVLLVFRKRYPDQPVSVELPDEFLCVPMDAVLIQQVLINLLENAVQHAEGMTGLWLKVRRRQDKVEFEVADDGCGIPKERLDTLFDGRGGGSDDRRHMGIGLSVCATIVHAHGGAIEAHNAPRGGAVFRFTLDAGKEEENGQQ